MFAWERRDCERRDCGPNLRFSQFSHFVLPVLSLVLLVDFHLPAPFLHLPLVPLSQRLLWPLQLLTHHHRFKPRNFTWVHTHSNNWTSVIYKLIMLILQLPSTHWHALDQTNLSQSHDNYLAELLLQLLHLVLVLRLQLLTIRIQSLALIVLLYKYIHI